MAVEIIKHGDLSKVDREYFICSGCGCEFMVPSPECFAIAECIAHACPECGTTCFNKKYERTKKKVRWVNELHKSWNSH